MKFSDAAIALADRVMLIEYLVRCDSIKEYNTKFYQLASTVTPP